MLASVEPVAADRKDNSSVSDYEPIRYQYSKMGFACLKFVIVDLLPDGCEDFWEQESGEVIWHSYYPSLAERTVFHETLAGRKYDGWPLLAVCPESGGDSSKGTVCTSEGRLVRSDPATKSGSTVAVLHADGGGSSAERSPWA